MVAAEVGGLQYSSKYHHFTSLQTLLTPYYTPLSSAKPVSLAEPDLTHQTVLKDEQRAKLLSKHDGDDCDDQCDDQE